MMTLKELEALEAMARDTGLRNAELLAAFRAPKKVLQSPPKFVPAQSAETFCKETHKRINQSRAVRDTLHAKGVPPLPGDGWSEWASGHEYVPGPGRRLINCYGWLR